MFNKSVSLLNLLKISDLGSFLLFTLASHCLPVGLGKLYEVENSDNYLPLTDLLLFFKSWVTILKTVLDVRKSTLMLLGTLSQRSVLI